MKLPVVLLGRLRFLALIAAGSLGLLPACAAEKAADPARFEKAIAAYEAEDKTNAPPKDATLFYGASNIRLWKSLPQRFGKQKVINRGFGGSQLSDCVHFADRVVIPYAPKTIYLNAGGNDLHAGKSPAQVLADFKAFVAKVRAALPKTQINYLCIPTSPARWSEVEQARQANQLIADYAKADGQLGFINYFPQLLGDDGQPRAELFVADKLHFSEAAYDIVVLHQVAGGDGRVHEAERDEPAGEGRHRLRGQLEYRALEVARAGFPGAQGREPGLWRVRDVRLGELFRPRRAAASAAPHRALRGRQ